MHCCRHRHLPSWNPQLDRLADELDGSGDRFCNLATRGTGTVPDIDARTVRASPRKRADARRNEQILLDAAAREIGPDMDAYELMRGIRNLCAGVDSDSRYDARRMVRLLIAGLPQSRPGQPVIRQPRSQGDKSGPRNRLASAGGTCAAGRWCRVRCS